MQYLFTYVLSSNINCDIKLLQILISYKIFRDIPNKQIYCIMTVCGKCSKAFNTRATVAARIVCNDCKTPFHGTCVNMTPEDINYYSEQSLIWRCDSCAKSRRQSMSIESGPENPMTYNDVFNLVSELRKDIKSIEESLGKSINSCFEELQEAKDLITKQSAEVTALVGLVNQLSTENNELRNRVILLEDRMDDAEQYSRRDTIEIHGVPVEPNEQVLEVVKRVGKALDVNIEDTMVSACHRLRTKDSSGKAPGIIVKMVRRMDADHILERRRVKRNLSTHDIGLTSRPALPVYVNESLSKGRRSLLNSAREKKDEKKYTYLWIRGGKILMRKADGTPVKIVKCRADLEKL